MFIYVLIYIWHLQHGLICCPCISWTEDSKQFPFETTNKIGAGPSEQKHLLPETWNTHWNKWLFPSRWWFRKSFYHGKNGVEELTQLSIHPLKTGWLWLWSSRCWNTWYCRWKNSGDHHLPCMKSCKSWDISYLPQLVNRRISNEPSAVWHTSPIWPPNWPRSELATKTLPTPGGGDVVIKMTWVPENSGENTPKSSICLIGFSMINKTIHFLGVLISSWKILNLGVFILLLIFRDCFILRVILNTCHFECWNQPHKKQQSCNDTPIKNLASWCVKHVAFCWWT